MIKKAATRKRAALVKGKPDDLAPLIAEVRSLIQSARHAVARTINTLQVLTNFEVGRRIVEHEQTGEKRAGYGTGLLNRLSARLTAEFGKVFSQSNLEYMRKFFLVWRDRVPQISQQPIGKLVLEAENEQPGGNSRIQQQPPSKLSPLQISQQPIAKFRREGKAMKGHASQLRRHSATAKKDTQCVSQCWLATVAERSSRF